MSCSLSLRSGSGRRGRCWESKINKLHCKLLGKCSCAQGGERSRDEEIKEDPYPSVVPFLPPLTDDTIKEYWTFYLSAVAVIITFGALLAPAMELHLGMGGAQSQFVAWWSMSKTQ